MASIGDITAHLRLDTSQFDRSLSRAKRRLYGSRLLIAYSYAMTVVSGVLATLLITR